MSVWSEHAGRKREAVKRYWMGYPGEPEIEADDGPWVEAEDALTEIEKHAQEIATLRNDLTAALLERDTARRDVSRLNMRCEAMGRMLYPHDDPAREAVAGDIGWVE